MPSIYVYFKTINKQVKESLQRELLCYDIEKKQMLKFQGGKLEYIYSFDPELNKYRLLPKVADVQIKINKTMIYGGLFHSEEDAARTYDTLAKEHRGRFARPNFAEPQ